MDSLLEHLDKDTLPRAMLKAFVDWCIVEQARSALVVVLTKTDLQDMAHEFEQTRDISALESLSTAAVDAIKQMRGRTGPLGLSAAEAAAFEFVNLLKASSEPDWDPEGAAFFSARVCGWAGWAASDFSQPVQKAEAEQNARRDQEVHLQVLWQKYNSSA
jgi:hypothetical protein